MNKWQITIFAIVFSAFTAPAFSAPKYDKSDCGFVQFYMDIKIENCYLNKAEIIITPTRPITRTAAANALADALIASSMNKVPVNAIAIFRSPKMDDHLEIRGTPLKWPDLGDGKKDHAAVVKMARDCKFINSLPACKP